VRWLWLLLLTGLSELLSCGRGILTVPLEDVWPEKLNPVAAEVRLVAPAGDEMILVSALRTHGTRATLRGPPTERRRNC